MGTHVNILLDFRREGLHLLSAEQCLDFVLRQVLPMRFSKREWFLAGAMRVMVLDQLRGKILAYIRHSRRGVLSQLPITMIGFVRL